MTYNVHFELAVLGFYLILFLVQIKKKKLPTRANTQFFKLMILIAAAGVISILVGFANRQRCFSIDVTIMINMLYALVCIGLLAMYFDYIMEITFAQWGRGMKLLFAEAVPAILCCVVISTPWTGFYCTVDSEGFWHAGKLLGVMYVIFMLYLFGSAVFIWLRAENFKEQKVLLIAVINALLALALLQMYLVDIGFSLLNIVAELGAFVYLLSIQSPDFYLDTRTGHFNFGGFVEVLRERIAYGRPAVCFVVRVRNFTALSRLYSENNLQTVQRQMGEIIEAGSRGLATYHIGSATYAVIADSLAEVEELHRKLRERLPYQWFVSREAIFHEYSYYRVSYPDDSVHLQEIMQRIHYARSDHRGHHAPGVLIHLQHQALEEAAERKKVAHLIEDAIMDNTLELHFQPIYSFAANRITSLEVLSRLKDDEKKYINPEYFIHVAEECHTIKALSLQMFDKACNFAKRNHIFDLGITDINVNLSPTHCSEKGAAKGLLQIAEKYEIPPEKLHFEITESKLNDNSLVLGTLQNLKNAGAKIALDDFGTGYSNLSSIQELPVDFVKIDKSLVWSYSNGENQFLTELLPMIKAEGKKIIAEGIETKEHIEILRGLCGDFLQGYYYSKPLPEEQFVRYLKEYNREYYT